MSDQVVLDLAHRRIDGFAGSPLVAGIGADERTSCEARLQQGIEAFQWLRQAEETLREADYEGIAEFTREQRDMVNRLYLKWHLQGQRAAEWAQRLEQRGESVTNWDRFQDVRDQVEGILDEWDWQERASRAQLEAEAEAGEAW